MLNVGPIIETVDAAQAAALASAASAATAAAQAGAASASATNSSNSAYNASQSVGVAVDAANNANTKAAQAAAAAAAAQNSAAQAESYWQNAVPQAIEIPEPPHGETFDGYNLTGDISSADSEILAILFKTLIPAPDSFDGPQWTTDGIDGIIDDGIPRISLYGTAGVPFYSWTVASTNSAGTYEVLWQSEANTATPDLASFSNLSGIGTLTVEVSEASPGTESKPGQFFQTPDSRLFLSDTQDNFPEVLTSDSLGGSLKRITSISDSFSGLLKAYPILVPIRGWYNGFGNFGSGQGNAGVYSDGIQVFGFGTITTSETFRSDTLAFNLPNGFAPPYPVRSSTILVSAVSSGAVVMGGGMEARANGGVAVMVPGQTTDPYVTTDVFFVEATLRSKTAGNFVGVLGNEINGDQISLMIPRVPQAQQLKLCIYFHGYGNDFLSHITDISASPSTQTLMGPMIQALLNDGYAILGLNGGSITDNWGNPQSFEATQSALLWANSILSFSKTVLIGQSMGGLMSLRAISQIEGISHWYGIYPVCDLQAIYDSGLFVSSMNTAYSGDFSSNKTGCDPLLFPIEQYSGKKFRGTGSPGDTLVSTAENLDALVTRITGTALSVSKLTTTGDHGDPSNFIPSDMISFFNS